MAGDGNVTPAFGTGPEAWREETYFKRPGRPDMEVYRAGGARMTSEALTAEVERLRTAIRLHRDQRGDDRCWLDDLTLYAALGDANEADNRVGDKFAMVRNCLRFIDRRCEGGGWPSYVELEAERDRLAAALDRLAARLVCNADPHYPLLFTGWAGGKRWYRPLSSSEDAPAELRKALAEGGGP